MTDDSENGLTIAVYSPSLSGLYYSELVLNFVQLCELKRYSIKVFRTGGCGEYDCPLGLDGVDAVIVIRNAVNVSWVRKLKEQGKLVVSISYDYFPLDIPLVAGDPVAGVELAFQEIRRQSKSMFGFVGNLNNYDVRKRFEAYWEHLEMHALHLDEDDVYSTGDDLLSGGHTAAAQFLSRRSSARGLVFGTAMNAIGFVDHIRTVDPELLDEIAIVAFDAHSLVPVLSPNIATVDQNLNLIAHKALAVAEELVKGASVQPKHLVRPKLIAQQDDTFDSPSAYMAISPEKEQLSDPNYMKCVLYNELEWVNVIVKGNLDPVMMLRPLFKKDMDAVCFGRFVSGGGAKLYFKMLKAVTPEKAFAFSPQHRESLCDVSRYPPDTPEVPLKCYTQQIHFVCRKDAECWGALSIFSDHHREGPGSLIAMVNYMERIFDGLTSAWGPPLANSKDRIRSPGEREKQLKGHITWNVRENILEWDDDALAILGFDSALDKGVYRNMEIYDRLKNSEITEVRECMMSAADTAFSIQVSLRNKHRSYTLCDLSCSGGLHGSAIQLTLKGL